MISGRRLNSGQRLGLLLWGASLGAAAAISGPVVAGAPPQMLPIEARWCLAPGRCIELEVADDDREQTLGLQQRPPLPPLRGMWFPYPEPTSVRFWMHHTPEPLDMVFVRDQRVVAIEAGARPCMRLPCPSYGANQPVDGVIELAAGQAEAQGIGVGTVLQIERLPLNRGASPAAPLGPARH